jgi:DNA oxidative demethylase
LNAPGFRHLPGYFTAEQQSNLLAAVRNIVRDAPFYRPAMPRTGKPLSVEMTNAGPLGWVTDRERGYRYQATHPVTGDAWPSIPPALLDLWHELADYPAGPEACLINYYAGEAKLGSHVDADEQEARAPVLSVSLGDDAIFHVGGLKRTDPKRRITLKSGDVVVLGGQARRIYHGVDRILPGTSQLLTEGGRINLTLRRVTVPDASLGH